MREGTNYQERVKQEARLRQMLSEYGTALLLQVTQLGRRVLRRRLMNELKKSLLPR